MFISIVMILTLRYFIRHFKFMNYFVCLCTLCLRMEQNGKTDDNRDQFTMSVSTGKMQGSESLITDKAILSWPGALLGENYIIILRIS